MTDATEEKTTLADRLAFAIEGCARDGDPPPVLAALAEAARAVRLAIDCEGGAASAEDAIALLRDALAKDPACVSAILTARHRANAALVAHPTVQAAAEPDAAGASGHGFVSALGLLNGIFTRPDRPGWGAVSVRCDLARSVVCDVERAPALLPPSPATADGSGATGPPALAWIACADRMPDMTPLALASAVERSGFVLAWFARSERARAARAHRAAPGGPVAWTVFGVGDEPSVDADASDVTHWAPWPGGSR